MLDKYFKHPLFWDYMLVTIAIGIIKSLLYFNKISLPCNSILLSISSDISGISFTSAGFIITLTTVLITFKSNNKVKKESPDPSNTIFELFFATNLYFETIKHLKNCVKSLIFISVSGYSIKLFVSYNLDEYLFLFCCVGITIITVTLWRCLLVLTKIMNLQKEG